MQHIQLEFIVRLCVDDKGEFTALCPKCKREIDAKEANVKYVSLNANEFEFFLEYPQECEFEKIPLTYVIIPISSATKRFSLQKNRNFMNKEAAKEEKTKDNSGYLEYLGLLSGNTDRSNSPDDPKWIPWATLKPYDPIWLPQAPLKDRHLFSSKLLEDYNGDIFDLDYLLNQDREQGNLPVRDIAKLTVELGEMDNNTRRNTKFKIQ